MRERFGNYEVLRKLASGGMAEVLLAKQRSLGGFERLVCLKRILPHLSSQEDFLKMFQDEARIAANLIHPNIAQIYDIAQEGDDYYIAMEYVRGEDLRRVYNQEVNRGNAIPRKIAALVAMGAAAGLDYAHRQASLEGKPLGIVHRDISPQNIVVTYDGHVKLVDFGVAKASGKLNETRAGVLKGKYSYMSPEQASGDPVDGRTDIFALGITLYEITTGTRLFKRPNELETLHAVIACNVPIPSSVVPGYDSELEAVVLKCLAYDPDGRYATAGDMERDLERYLLNSASPTSASSLATYMQELFAEKMADEALFGGSPWGENLTPSRPMRVKTSDVVLEPSAVSRVVEWDATVIDPLPSQASTVVGFKEGIHRDWDVDAVNEPTSPGLPTPAAQRVANKPRVMTPLAPRKGSRAVQRTNWAAWIISTAWVLCALIAGGLVWDIRHPFKSTPHPPGTPAIVAEPIDDGQPPDPDSPGDDVTATDANQPAVAQGHDFGAYLTVTAPLTLEVTLGNRFLGNTPIAKLSMEAGQYRLKLENKREGLILRRNVELTPGETAAVTIGSDKGFLAINAKPWAWVKVGTRPASETPLRLQLFEGEYTLLFECPDGRRRTQLVTVAAGRTQLASVNCERN